VLWQQGTALPYAASFGDKDGERAGLRAPGYPCPHSHALAFLPGIACARGGHGQAALPWGRDEQVGSEGLTSALGADAAGAAGADERSCVLPGETHPS